MYSMFISAIVDCAIHHLILCPNDLFWSQKADVRTCILVLQKGKQYQDKIQISNRPNNTHNLKEILENRRFNEVDIDDIVLSKKKTVNQFIVDRDVLSLFHNPRVGEVHKCITGI